MTWKWLRDPLFHFLLVGLLVFFWNHGRESRQSPPADETTIVVDEAALLQFMQNRARVFSEAPFRERLSAMSPVERERLIEDFIREEVLHREAKAMELDRDDYIIRRRLVQKMEFITDSLSGDSASLSEEDVADYFDTHRADYFIEPSITFTHVFFDAERRGESGAMENAREKLKQLNAESVEFSEAVQHGDRFPYHLNYVDRTLDFIELHFGKDAAKEIAALEADPAAWQGPVPSQYGVHLLLIAGRTAGRDAELEEIYDRVRIDAELEHKRKIANDALQELISAYRIEVRYPAES